MTDVEALEMTYLDLATVERLEKVKDEKTGVTNTIKNKIYENVKCAVSKSDNQLMTTDGVGKLSFSHKLFISPNYEILEGDIVTITSMGKISIYLASKPFYYSSHSETLLSYKERA